MIKSTYCRLVNYRKSLLLKQYLASPELGVVDIKLTKINNGFFIEYPVCNLISYSSLCSLAHTADNTID